MKKWLAVILAVVLLGLMRAGIHNLEPLCWHSQSVSLRYAEPLTPQQVQAARSQDGGLTFWCEQEIRLTAAQRGTDLTALLYVGDAALVWGQPCQSGSLPAQLDVQGCALSTAAADALFGSENVVGLAVTWGDKQYQVRGIFANDHPIAVLPDPDAEFCAVELQYSDAIRQDPETRISAVLQKTGLPTPKWQLYPAEILAVARWMTWIPILFAALVLVIGLVRLCRGWPVLLRDAALFFVLLAIVFAMPVFLQDWPQWLTPSRWSDFTWWRQTLDQLGQHFLVWLRVSPSFRDICMKTAILRQMGITVGECVLCEMLRCLFWAQSRPAEKPAAEQIGG